MTTQNDTAQAMGEAAALPSATQKGGTMQNQHYAQQAGVTAPENNPTDPPMVAAALDLAAAGWEVFPLGENTKRPLTAHGVKDATTDADTIRAWWERNPGANLGLAPGTDLLVLDVDTKHGIDGHDTLTGFEFVHGELPPTRTTETPSGGWHLYFKKPPELRIKNRVNVRPGLDVRTLGGYLVAPPSVIDGKPYRWLNDAPMADAPPWLVALVTEEKQPAPPMAPQAPTAAPRGAHDAYTQRAIDRATIAVLSAGPGGRNNELNATTYGIARLAAAGRLDWGQVSQALERAAGAAGLALSEIRATLKSAWDAGSTNPNFYGMPRDNGQTLQQWDIDADTGELREDSAQEAQEPRLKPVDVAQVLTDPDDPPRFVWGQYLPRGVVSMLGAHGGTGKSTIALMLAVAVASGRGELFGQPCDQGRAVFVSLEDGRAIVRHRLATICKEWNIAPELLVNRLTIADGTDWPELFSADRDDGQVTPTYRELRNLAQGADLVLIDNASDGFGGDEIKRRQVRAFIRSLAAIAKAEDAAMLLLAHVDKSTSKKLNQDGEGYSGSTAWHNSVRSRLFMERVSDGGLRIAHQKANLGQTAELLNLVWPKDGLPEVAHTMAPEGLAFANEQHTKNLLRLIAEFGERGEHVTSATTSRTNAAKLLEHEPSYPKSLKPAEVFDLLRRAERAGYLEKGQHRTPHRKVLEVWELTAQGRGFVGLAPTAPTAPTYDIDEVSAQGAMGAMGAPTAPTCVGGMGERARAQVGAQVGAIPHTLAPKITDCADFKNDYASATQGW